ncbi:MAG: amidase family protein [Alphaproteobacteria bacterium]|jgi:Asp-tRNA(Asn)/Glu-tRNA(Gln) amidotransferase A subunit family amidase|nr:amidase family protein [Alphaproteobacteria bacterium]
MAAFKDYGNYDAVGLAELIRGGEVTIEEVLETALTRMRALQPELNAVVTEMETEARQAIADGLPDGPFKGVPFMLKDLNCLYAGVPMQNGSRFFADFVPDHDGEIVIRQKRAGLVSIAKTNTPEFGLCASTEPVAHGAAPNPWNLERSGGGSSGGSATAVAAGIVPAAHATDGGGSIRIPASCCGLVGLKPTRGRTPVGPDLGESLNSVGHVVCHTVRDTAHLLDAIAGPELGAPNGSPPMTAPFADAVGADPGRLKVAVSTEVHAGSTLDPACTEAVEQTAALLAELGHEVEEAAPPVDLDWIAEVWRLIAGVNAAANLDRYQAASGRDPGPDDLEPISRLSAEEGRRVSGPDYLRTIQDIHAFGRRMAHFHEDWDILLTPTLAERPVPLGALVMTTEDIDDYYDRLFRFIAFTPQQNLTGQPAITLPLHMSDDGLPVGVQLATRFGEESLLIRLASQLEAARPWADRRPPVHAG